MEGYVKVMGGQKRVDRVFEEEFETMEEEEDINDTDGEEQIEDNGRLVERLFFGKQDIVDEIKTCESGEVFGEDGIDMDNFSVYQQLNNLKPEKEGIRENQHEIQYNGVSIPENSELLKKNIAYGAYNALSDHLKPLMPMENPYLNHLPLSLTASHLLPFNIQFLLNSISIIDNLSTQILRIIALGTYQKIIDIVSSSKHDMSASFKDLIFFFEFNKKLYSENDPFLTVDHLAPGFWKSGEKIPCMFKSKKQCIESTLRKVNLTTFLLATLGTIEVGFFYLNEYFLDIFCPNNQLDPANSIVYMKDEYMECGSQNLHGIIVGDKVGKLLKTQSVLFLELKTQAYISAIEAGETCKEKILNELFPENLKDVLLMKRKTKTLSPTEIFFIEKCNQRKKILLDFDENEKLNVKYDWFLFLKDLFEYVIKNVDFLIWGKKTKKIKDSNISVKNHSCVDAKESTTSHNINKDIMNSSFDVSENFNYPSLDLKNDILIDPETSRKQTITQLTNNLLPSEIQEQQIHLSLSNRLNAKQSQRRPWAREEEKALRHALELKGPQWSTILTLFGSGGKISEALKNRTQVQLKDKARNWKMFFLKSGLPVPTYLQKVTGDLERGDKMKKRLKQKSICLLNN